MKKIQQQQYNTENLLYKQFVAWSCGGWSVAPLKNPVFEELVSQDDYFDVRSDERMYLDLRASTGYVKEAEKLERNDSKINLHLTLKEAAS